MSSATKISRGRDATPALPVGTQISALIFDLDGTLYLQGPVRRAILWRLLRAGLARPVSTWRECRLVYYYRRAQEHLRGCPQPLASQQLPLACEWSSARPEDAAKTIAHWMEDAPLETLARCLRPGVVDFLETAKNKGIRLGVVSDYPATTKLQAMGLDDYFSVVLTAQDARVGLFKPSPNGLKAALEDMGVEPGRAVYIGDRPAVDGETAHRAGVAGVILDQPLGSNGRGWIGVPDIPSLSALLII
jgi:HAD superfamily hydrolase (TIGR01549 family)